MKNLGVNYGLVFTGFGVAGTIGPMLGGKIRDAFGNYHNAFTISAIMLQAGAALAFTLRAPKLEPVPVSPSGPGGTVRSGQAEAVK